MDPFVNLVVFIKFVKIYIAKRWRLYMVFTYTVFNVGRRIAKHFGIRVDDIPELLQVEEISGCKTEVPEPVISGNSGKTFDENPTPKSEPKSTDRNLASSSTLRDCVDNNTTPRSSTPSPTKCHKVTNSPPKHVPQSPTSVKKTVVKRKSSEKTKPPSAKRRKQLLIFDDDDDEDLNKLNNK